MCQKQNNKRLWLKASLDPLWDSEPRAFSEARNSILPNFAPNIKGAVKKMEITSTLATGDDKTIQITFTVPYTLVKEAQEKVVTQYAKETEIPGFRKGKAPAEKIREKIPQSTLIEKSLAKILPEALSQTITKNKIRPAIYPKFELVSAKENEDWQIRAVTCELPEVILGDYKGAINSIIRLKDMPKEEKEQKIIKTLLETHTINLPQLLITEEVDSRLSSLLARIEKLGLTLEGYLGSIGKNPKSLRKEYEIQSRNTIALELILNQIAKDQKISATEAQINDAIKAASADPKLVEKLENPDQKRLIGGVLTRRATLDYLVSLL